MMFLNQTNPTKLKKLRSILLLLFQEEPSYSYTQKSNYVDVKMKWKKDSFYDCIEIIHESPQLKPLISLKNCIANESDGSIPISAVSKRGFELGVPIKITRFLRQYPSVFEEFTGPNYNLPWFRLTSEAVNLDREERAVYEDRRLDLNVRLKKLILMSKEKKLPLKIIQGLQWYLGLPDDFLQNPEVNLDETFKFVEMEEGLRGLAVDSDERMLSVIQRNALKRGVNSDGSSVPLSLPLFPSKGLRLKRKISSWPSNATHMFYLSLRNKTCTAILKEAYSDDSAMETHLILEVRKKYIRLMKKSEMILKKSRQKQQYVKLGNVSSNTEMDSEAGEKTRAAL
ncbi:hypothetical protein HHK36_016841 [Tetracentron sinense]|uniref:PORR domain-containing protein n=1 Tax=Tetracentron sinense TaxID=13715 RepID=A0A834Z3H3_TETSI|nr:hypothetical protein HHK36_016841 [Tetracentron sinense]